MIVKFYRISFWGLFLAISTTPVTIAQSNMSERFGSPSARPLTGYSQQSIVPLGGGGFLPVGPGSMGGPGKDMMNTPTMPSISGPRSMSSKSRRMGQGIGVMGAEPLRASLGAGGSSSMIQPRASMGSPLMSPRKPVGNFPFVRPTPLPASSGARPAMAM